MSDVITSIIKNISPISVSTFSEGGRTLSELVDVDLQGVSNGSLLVYNTNEFVARTLSGDATISADGVLTVNADAILAGALPQDIYTTSSPTFNNITLNGVINNTNLSFQLNSKAPKHNPIFSGVVSGITSAMVGLSNVDNTSDINKPVSTATQLILDGKSSTSHIHSNVTTTVAGFMSTSDKTKLDAITGTNTGDQTITLTGDASGSGATLLTVTLGNTGVVAGEYNNSTTTITPFTVDSKGRITATDTEVTITPDWSSVANTPTTLGGYNITDAVNVGETQTITGAKEFTTSPIVRRPTESNHAVNKAYADDISAGLHVHEQVHVILTIDLATATGGTVAYTNGTDGVGAKLTVTGGSTIIIALNAACGEDDDLVAGENGSRIIINGEVDNKNWNGIYVISADRELTRAADFDSLVEMAGGDFVFVTHGITHADTGWVLSEPVTTVGSSNIEFVQFSGQGSYDAGDGLHRDGTVFSVVGTTGRIVVGSSVDLAMHGTTGTYKSVTTDAYGRVTSGSNPTTLTGYGITDAAALSGATFTGAVSATSFATPTGTSSQFLKADGSLDASQYVNYDGSGVNIEPRGAIIGSTYGCNRLDVTSYTMGIKGLLYGINVQTSPDLVNLHNWYFNPNGTFTFPDNTVQSTAFTGLQTITLTGDVTGSGTGSFATTLKSVGVAGTYQSVTTDSNGRVTSGTNPTTLSGYGITDASDNSNTIIGLSLFL